MENTENNARRSFIKTTSIGVAAAAISPALLHAETIKKPVIIPQGAKGANDRVRVAVLGVNGRGKTHIEEIMDISQKCNVEVAVLCDPDMDVLQSRAADFEKKYGKKSYH